MRLALADHQAAPDGVVTLFSKILQTFSPAAIGIGALLLTLPPVSDAQRLGRLFSTSDERALLDELRRERQIVDPDPQVVEVVPDAPSVEQVTINGLVLRSSGPDSAWVNGRQVDGGARTRDGVRVDTSVTRGGRVKIILPSGAETIALKPGQKIDVESGVVVEGYERSSGPRAYTVFDRVSAEAARPSFDAAEAQPREDGPAEGQPAPARADGVPYPEALLEKIRRALQGN
jgi:hypothetical protein